MIAILSPAKNLDFSPLSVSAPASEPVFQQEAGLLVDVLQTLSVLDFQDLFKVNPTIAQLSYNRFYQWQKIPEAPQTKPALFAFHGEVYRGLDAASLTVDAIDYAQSSLRILSGLYGVLAPLDAIQPYRLEMGTHISVGGCKNLYEYWKVLATKAVQAAIESSPGDRVLINLASNEYYKVLNRSVFNNNTITIDFKEDQNGVLKNITVYAKRARGLMARFIAFHQIEKADYLKAFDWEGYYFSHHHSTANCWTFVRASI